MRDSRHHEVQSITRSDSLILVSGICVNTKVSYVHSYVQRIQDSTGQYSTMQDGTRQCKTVQNNTRWYKTVCLLVTVFGLFVVSVTFDDMNTPAHGAFITVVPATRAMQPQLFIRVIMRLAETFNVRALLEGGRSISQTVRLLPEPPEAHRLHC